MLKKISVCSNKNKGEVASVSSETSACKFFDDDHISKIKAGEKNIYLVKNVFSNGSFKIDVPVDKDLPLLKCFYEGHISEKDSVAMPY